jgi:signal transduction histidine kinase
MVYSVVNVVLLDQVDTTLAQAAEQVIDQLRVTPANQFDSQSLSSFSSSDNLIVQVWGRSGELSIAIPERFRSPLDERGRLLGRSIFETAQGEGRQLRVLSVPLRSSRGPVGTLQVGFSLNFINVIQRTLASILALIIILAMAISGLAAWLVTGRALAPLAVVTDVATTIIRADDLQRRIPLTGPANDEVGRLILAFNQTLERLENLFTSQRRFLADVSHELRTPLTVIKGNAGLMRRAGEADEESLSSIEAEVDRLTRMVGDLLLLAQVESGRLPLDMAPVELDTVLLEVFQQMRLLAGDRLQLRISEIDQVQVLGDRDRLKQVLLNLVSNAVQYTPAGGQVNLALSKSEKQAQFTVSDSGPGIPAEDLPHIFERFYRGEKSRKRSKGTGFGLGLSIAYWIVRSHGGSIEVSSKEKGGTTFCVRLPLSEPEQQLSSRSPVV